MKVIASIVFLLVVPCWATLPYHTLQRKKPIESKVTRTHAAAQVSMAIWSTTASALTTALALQSTPQTQHL